MPFPGGFAPGGGGGARLDLLADDGAQMLRFRQSSPCGEYVVPLMACGHVGPYFVASNTTPGFAFLTFCGAFHLQRVRKHLIFVLGGLTYLFSPPVVSANGMPKKTLFPWESVDPLISPC